MTRSLAMYVCAGSVPTDEAEASAIIDGADYIKNMGKPFWPVTGPHSDDAAEADMIIDNVSKYLCVWGTRGGEGFRPRAFVNWRS